MSGSARPYSASGSSRRSDHELRRRPARREQPQEVRPGKRDAAFRRSVVLAGDMPEDGAAQAGDRPTVVVAQPDDEGVEPVLAPPAVVAGGLGQPPPPLARWAGGVR